MKGTRLYQPLMMCFVFALGSSNAHAISSDELWEQYKSSPNVHSNIPNNSYAGYHQSDIPPPNKTDFPITLRVKDFGAKGDGKTDDTQAFQIALKQLEAKPGGVLLIPQGTFKLSGVLRLGSSGIILRGDGVEKTTLVLTKPLSQIYGPALDGDSSEYSWAGGLIHVGPKENFSKRGKLNRDDFYGWEDGSRLSKVPGNARRGDFEIQIEGGHRFRAGDRVFLVWQNSPDHSLLKYLAGPVLGSFPWDGNNPR